MSNDIEALQKYPDLIRGEEPPSDRRAWRAASARKTPPSLRTPIKLPHRQKLSDPQDALQKANWKASAPTPTPPGCPPSGQATEVLRIARKSAIKRSRDLRQAPCEFRSRACGRTRSRKSLRKFPPPPAPA